MRVTIYGLAAGTVIVAVAAWLLLADRSIPPPSPLAVPAPTLQEATQQRNDVAAQPQPVAGPAESRSSAAFEARFKAAKAAREAPQPPPDPAIGQARTFAEAFQAMKRAEGQSPPAQDAGANPFAAAR